MIVKIKKSSESYIRIRLPVEEKKQFSENCAKKNLDMSKVLTAFIQGVNSGKIPIEIDK